MRFFKKAKSVSPNVHVWAREGMDITFRAEIMPSKSLKERTFKVKKVLRNGRVILEDFLGEYREGSFEPINFMRKKAANTQNS